MSLHTNTYPSEMKMQQDASERCVYQRGVHTQATSNDVASSSLKDIHSKKISVGVLALQGCVKPHQFHIESLGAEFREIKTENDLFSVDGLILPGGESSTMLKLIDSFNLENALKKVFSTIPVWGICAGAILMAKKVTSPTQKSFHLLDMEVERNGYGNQLNSFNAVIENCPVSFIRAPKIKSLSSDIIIKSTYNNEAVWVQKNLYMATTFHSELNFSAPSKMHIDFLNLIKVSKQKHEFV